MSAGLSSVIHRHNMLLGSTAQADGESKGFPLLSAVAQSWGRLGTVTEDKARSQPLLIHAVSCRVMCPQDAERLCGYLSKKGIVPTCILETKKHRINSGRIW